MDAYVVFTNDLASQWTSTVWSALWQSTVLAAGILLSMRLLKRAPATLRYWVWMLVPLRLLVMPALTISLPVLPAPAPEPAAMAAEATPIVGSQDEWAVSWHDSHVETSETPDPYAMTQPAVPPLAAAPQALDWLALVMAAWGLGALMLFLRMARGWWWMRRLVAKGQTLHDGPVVDAACKAVTMLGLKGLPRIVLTEACVAPFTFGIRRPVIVLSGAFVRQVSKEGLLAVLAHECAHLRRRDSLLGLVLGICDTLYFFHPVVHWVKRRIFFERERACDDLVLATSKAKPSAYANAICVAASISRDARPLTSPPVLVAESFSDLKARLTALASEVRPRATLSKASLFMLVVLSVICIPGIMLTTARPAESLAHATPSELPASETPGAVRDVPISLTTAEDSGPIAAQPTATTRIIHFPDDHALGAVYVRRAHPTRRYRLGPEYSAVDPWDFVAAAQGDVAVPTGRDIKLNVDIRNPAQDFSPLMALKPGDLQVLAFYSPNDAFPSADDTVMPYISGLTGLEELTLLLPDLTNRGMEHVRNLTNLRQLYLASRGVTDNGLNSLGGMQSLEVFSCWASITDNGLARIGELSALQELSLNVTCIRGRGLTHLASIPKLEYLMLGGDNFGNSGLQYLHALPALKSLRLHGENLKISDPGMRYIAQLEQLEELHFAWIDGITDRGIEHLKSMRSLKLLHLHKAITTDAALASISEIESLEELTLSNNPRSILTDTGLSYLPRLKNLRCLRTMGTSNSLITDEGLRHLGMIPSLRQLQVSGGEGITDTGIAHLASLRNLEVLWLFAYSSGITNQSLATISTLKNLRSLQVNGKERPFSTSGVSRLNDLSQLEFLSIAGIRHDDSVLKVSNLTRLEDATIGMDTCTDADLVSVGKLTRLKRLQGIAGITDTGLSHLADLTELQVLNIGKSHLTDDGLQHLAHMNKLNVLGLSGAFTAEGTRHLEHLYGLRILRIDNRESVDGPELEHAMQALDQLQATLPNLTRIDINGSRSLAAGYGG